jgi:uncharacterized membrane protein
MSLMERIAIASLATGLALLGVIGFVTHKFAMQWQPVPDSLPGYSGFAYACAFFELAAGVLLLFDRKRSASLMAVAIFVLLWAALLHLPHVVTAPADLVGWLGFAEIAFIGLGTLAAARLRATKNTYGSVLLCFFSGLALLIFGSTHFVFEDFTAKMIPSWLPAPLFWAYLTGSGHIATGLALFGGAILLAPTSSVGRASENSGTMRFKRLYKLYRQSVLRVATLAFALMISSFVLFLHVPRVAVLMNDRAEWTMLAIALCIQAGAWAMASEFAYDVASDGEQN